MVTTLYLIPHGETEGGDIKRYYRTHDIQLSGKGLKQIGRTSSSTVETLKSSSKYTSHPRDIHDLEKNEEDGRTMKESVKSSFPRFRSGKRGTIREMNPPVICDDERCKYLHNRTGKFCFDHKRNREKTRGGQTSEREGGWLRH